MSETNEFLARAEIVKMLVRDDLTVSLIEICTIIHRDKIEVPDSIKDLSQFKDEEVSSRK